MPLVSERIFDTSRRSYLPVEMDRLLHNKIMANPIICVGEVHTDLNHHRAELEILKVGEHSTLDDDDDGDLWYASFHHPNDPSRLRMKSAVMLQ